MLACKDTEEANTRLSAIAKGSREDADMEVAPAKTKMLPIQRRIANLLAGVTTGDILHFEEKIEDADFKHKCEYCTKPFSSNAGMLQHTRTRSRTLTADGDAKWNCGPRRREPCMFQADGATIDYIDAVRGGKTDHMRFYRAHWEGTDDTTWASEAQLKSDDELAAIDFFWATNPEIHKSETQECEAEWRCTFAGCCSPTTGSIFEDGDELDAHQQSCVYRPTSRKNTKTLTAMETREEKARISEMEDVLMEGIPIETVYDFQYLGVWFQSDGDQTTKINCMLARASTAFARMRHI